MHDATSHAATTIPDYFPSPQVPWAVHRGDGQNTGRFPGNLRRTAPVGRRPWRFDTGGIVWATPLVGHDGELYVGSASKRFYCINAEGTERWRFELPDAPEALIDGTAALLRDLVVVPGGDGVLYALERATGGCRWRFRAYHAAHHASGRVVDSLEAGVGVGPDGRVYVGSDNGHLYCLTTEGDEVWNFRTNMMLWSTPAFAPNGTWLAVGSLDRRLYVIDRRTGEKIVSAKLAGELKGSPAIGANGDIYVGCSDGSIRCYRLVDNGWTRHLEQRWRHNTQGEVYASPALAEGCCVVGSHDGHVYCFDQRTGARKWSHDLRSRVSASAVISKDGLVIVGARCGGLYILSLGDGQCIGSFQTAAGRHVNLDASPSVDAIGRIFVGSYDGSVYCVPTELPLSGLDRMDTESTTRVSGGIEAHPMAFVASPITARGIQSTSRE